MPNKCLPPWTRVSTAKSDRGNKKNTFFSINTHNQTNTRLAPRLIDSCHFFWSGPICSYFLTQRFGKRGSNDEALQFIANMDQSYNGQVRPRWGIYCSVWRKLTPLPPHGYWIAFKEAWIDKSYWRKEENSVTDSFLSFKSEKQDESIGAIVICGQMACSTTSNKYT